MDLQERLDRLERAGRLQRWLLLGALAAAPLAWSLRPALAADAPASETAAVVAVKNASGTLVASVRATEDGSALTLCDAAGKPKLLFAVNKDGPGIYLLDGREGSPNRGIRAALTSSERNGPSLALFNNSAAQPAAAVKLKGDGQTGMFVATDGSDQRYAFPRQEPEDAAGQPSASKGSRAVGTPVSGGGKKTDRDDK